MSDGIGPEFLRILEGIEWSSLNAKSAVQLRAALKKALASSDAWFEELSRDFGQQPAAGPIYNDEGGRPPEQASIPHTAAPPAKKPPPKKEIPSKKKRPGRPTPIPKPKIRLKGGVNLKVNRPEPLAIGGADAETGAGPQTAKLFENSYVSKDGPRPDMPAALPANHPRRGLLNRESSVTPDVDMSDFDQVEAAMKTGKGVKNVFQ